MSRLKQTLSGLQELGQARKFRQALLKHQQVVEQTKLQLLNRVAGSPLDHPHEARVLAAIYFVMGVGFLIGIPQIIFQQLSRPALSWSTNLIFWVCYAIGLSLISWFYYLVRFRKRYSENLVIAGFILSQLFFITFWILVGGLVSGIQFFFILIILFAAVLLRTVKRRLAIGSSLVIWVYFIQDEFRSGALEKLSRLDPDLLMLEVGFFSVAAYIMLSVILSILLFTLDSERRINENLLNNLFPEKIARDLKHRGASTPRKYESASVLFTDFVGFTKIAENLSSEELINELDLCFSQFDHIAEKYNLEKIKTIGDSFMACGGVPVENHTHAFDAVLAALEIRELMNQIKAIKGIQNLPYWELRIGIHRGPLIAGVIGEKKFAFDVFGDTVNTASRMESRGVVGQINISRAMYDQVRFLFQCRYRGKINAKNKGAVEMFLVEGIKPAFSVDGAGLVPNREFLQVYERIKNGARLKATGGNKPTKNGTPPT